MSTVPDAAVPWALAAAAAGGGFTSKATDEFVGPAVAGLLTGVTAVNSLPCRTGIPRREGAQ